VNFIDFEFWPTLLFGLLAIFSIRWAYTRIGRPLPGDFDKYALGVLSLVLLAGVNLLTFAIFLSLSVLAYVGMLALANIPVEKRRLFLGFYIPILLLPLIYYKYRTFLLEQVIGWEELTLGAIAIPAGISFYTFQMIAVMVDGSRLKSYKPKAIDFLNFISFFPQVVAGPIERKSDLMGQVENFRFRPGWQALDNGASWLALGFFYKVCLADNLSPFIDRDAMQSAWPILWNTFLFGLKIYFDFCGYSLIALGLGKCLGVDLTLNFRSPYFSGNIRDFWRRWHVSLSFWFRDYVYIPLGGSKNSRWAINLMVVFVLSGLWHGAGWGFILWGALHEMYCVVSHALKDRIQLPGPLGWLLTISVVFLAWLPFFETRWGVLCDKLRILIQMEEYSAEKFVQFAGSFGVAQLSTMAVGVAFCLAALGFEAWSARKRDYYGFARSRIAIAILVFATIFFGSSQGNSFIYFSF